MKIRMTAIAILSALTVMPVQASDNFICSCLDNKKSDIELNSEKNMSCVGTFSADNPEELSLKEHYIKVYLKGSEFTQEDDDVNYNTHPINGACIEESGSLDLECDTSKEYSLSTDELDKISSFGSLADYRSQFSANTTKKEYNVFTLYKKNGSEKDLVTFCLEDK